MALTQQFDTEWLWSGSDFEHLVAALTGIGCEYDDKKLPDVAPCEQMGWINFLASLAAGIWFTPAGIHYSTAGGVEIINTDARPAMIQDARPGAGYWAATFYREGRSTDNKKIKYFYDDGDPTGVVQTPVLVVDTTPSPIKAGSGIHAVREPSGHPTNTVALFFKDDTSNSIKYTIGTLGGSAITGWTVPATAAGAGVATDRTPTAVNFNSQVHLVFKDAATNTLKFSVLGTAAAAISYGGANMESQSAPTAVVAEGRLWVFYRKYGNPLDSSTNKIYYTSKPPRGSWAAPTLLEDTNTLWDPEAVYFTPTGGAVGDGRIWVFYKRPSDPSHAEPEAGTRMVSMKPTSSGTTGDYAPPVFLYQTRLPPSYEPFHTAFPWDGILRLYHPREEAGEQVDGVWPMWKVEKLGEG
jgi:hypothetical protein